MRASWLVVVAAALLVAARAMPAQTTDPAGEMESALTLWGYGRLVLTVPAGWNTERRSGTRENVQPYVGLLPPHRDSQPKMEIRITPAFPPRDEPMPADLGPVVERIRDLLRQRLGAQSGPIRSIVGDGPPAFAFDLITREPGPLGFTRSTLAFRVIDGVLFRLEFGCDEVAPPEREQAIAILRQARLVVPTTQPTEITLRAPSLEWEVAVTTPGFHGSTTPEVSLDVQSITVTQEKLGMQLSLAMSPPYKQGGDARLVRAAHDEIIGKLDADHHRSREGLERGGDERRATERYFYTARDFQEMHQLVFFEHNGVWVYVDLVKFGYQPGDRALMDQIVSSTRAQAVTLPPRASQPRRP